MNRRITKHQALILKTLRKNHLLTLPELSERLPDIDFSTIYRNIKKFLDEGLVREITLQGGTTSYESTDKAHDHVVCDSCNTVFPLQLPTSVSSSLPKGFMMREGGTIIRGTCTPCAQA